MTEDQAKSYVAFRDRVVSSFLGHHTIHGVRAHAEGIEIQCTDALPDDIAHQVKSLCGEIPVQYKIGPLEKPKEKDKKA